MFFIESIEDFFQFPGPARALVRRRCHEDPVFHGQRRLRDSIGLYWVGFRRQWFGPGVIALEVTCLDTKRQKFEFVNCQN